MCDLFSDLFETKYKRMADGFKKRYGDLFEHDAQKEIEYFQVRHIYTSPRRIAGAH